MCRRFQHALISRKVFRRMNYCHLNHGGTLTIRAVCVRVFRTGAYIHGLSGTLPPRDMLSPSQDKPPREVCVDTDKFPGGPSDLVSIQTCSGQPDSVPYVSFLAGAYGRLPLATYMSTGRPGPYWPVIGSRLSHAEFGEWLLQPKRGGGWLTSAD